MFDALVFGSNLNLEQTRGLNDQNDDYNCIRSISLNDVTNTTIPKTIERLTVGEASSTFSDDLFAVTQMVLQQRIRFGHRNKRYI